MVWLTFAPMIILVGRDRWPIERLSTAYNAMDHLL
jgi:hypothetical protein